MSEDASKSVDLHIDENELPLALPAPLPGPAADAGPSAIGGPMRRLPTAVAVVPGTLLARDEELAAVRSDIASLAGFSIVGAETIGSGWNLIRFEVPADVAQEDALAQALTRLNDGRADLPGLPGGDGSAGRGPRAFANRIVGCPRLMGGGLPAAPEPANSPSADPPLGQGPGAGATVAVLDTVPIHHPELDGQVVGMPAAAAPVAGDTSTSAIGHCLLVAGIVLRYAPAAKVRVVGVLGNDGSGSEADLARALNELAEPDAGIQLVNLSLCTPASRLPAVEDAVKKLHAAGVGVVAAAGNANPEEYALTHEMLPAAFPTVVGVAALGGNGPGVRLASFSQRGPWVRCAAPGEHEYGPFVTGSTAYGTPQAPVQREFRGWCYWDGTSFAAPAVTGAAAAHLAANPGETGVEALAAVLSAVRPAQVGDSLTMPLVASASLWPTVDPGVLTLSSAA